jgi:hypothetical protein
VDITNRLFRRHNSFSVYFQDILEYTVCGGVSGTKVQRGGLLTDGTFGKLYVLLVLLYEF